MRNNFIKKDRKKQGVKVYYIDDAFRLREGTIKEVWEKESTCIMVNQHVDADKKPVIMKVPNKELKQSNV